MPDELLDLGGGRGHDPRPGAPGPLWADPALAEHIHRRCMRMAATAALAWDAERDPVRRRALAELAATAAVIAQEWSP
jgi:hypothetical protein